MYTPFPFASVLPESIALIECAALILLMLSICIHFMGPQQSRLELKIKPVMPIIGLFLFALLQLIPLPENAIKLISPHTLIIKNLSHNAYLDDLVQWLSHDSGTPLISGTIFPWNCLSLYPYGGWYKLLFYIAMGMMFYSFIMAVNSKQEIRLVTIAVIISGIIQAFLYLISYLKGKPLMNQWYGYEMKKIGGAFVNRDHYSAYLSMILPVLAAWTFYYSNQLSHSHRSRVSKVVSFVQAKKGIIAYMIIMLVLMSVGQLFSLSRAGIGSCLCSLIILIYLFSLRAERMKITTILLLIVLIIMTLTYWIGYYPILERFKLIPHEWESKTGRWVVWQDSLKIVKDFPVAGVGLANFSNAFVHYKRFSDTRYSYAHNDILQFLVEMGIPGLALLILTVIFFYRQILVHPWQAHSRMRALVLGITAGTIAVLIHSFFDFPLQIPANALLLTIYCGLLYSSIKIDAIEKVNRIKEKQEAKQILLEKPHES